MVCFLEIYQEEIEDLLMDEEALKKRALVQMDAKKLAVREHPSSGTFIPGLTEVAVGSAEEVMQLLAYGMTLRKTASTAMNATSSRSHCIFTFKTSMSEDDGGMKMSQTHIVELAGSERADKTKATGDRLKEGAAINQSLSALANVVSDLSKKGNTKPAFRTSKLTHILKESLTGNSKTIMMAAISPASGDHAETLSTMKFAQSVKLVQTKACVNTVAGGASEALVVELLKLKAQLQEYESSKMEDAHLIHKLQRSIDDNQYCQKSHSRLCDKKTWEESLAHDREKRNNKLEKLDENSMAFLLKLNEEMEAKRGSGSESSLSTPRSAEAPEVMHIKLSDLSLEGLRSNLITLESQTSKVAALVNDSEDPGSTQVRLTPMLALTMSGGAPNFVVKTERFAAADDQAEEAEEDAYSDEWLSEDEFRARCDQLAAMRREGGEEDGDESPSAGETGTTAFSLFGGATAAAKSAGLPRNLRASNALVQDLQNQLRNAQDKIDRLAPRYGGHVGPADRDVGSLSLRPPDLSLMPPDAAGVRPGGAPKPEGKSQHWKLISSEVGKHKAVMCAAAELSGEAVSTIRSGCADLARASMLLPSDVLEGMHIDGAAGSATSEPSSTSTTRKAKKKKKPPPTPQELKNQASIRFGYNWSASAKEPSQVDLRPGAGTGHHYRHRTSQLRTASTPPVAASSAKKTSHNPTRRNKTGAPPRSAAYHWVKSLSSTDPVEASYEEALVGKSAAITLFEAMKDRKVAETIR